MLEAGRGPLYGAGGRAQKGKNKDDVAGMGLLLDFDGDKQRFSKSRAQPAPKPAPEPPVQQSMFRPVHSGGPTPFDSQTGREEKTE